MNDWSNCAVVRDGLMTPEHRQQIYDRTCAEVAAKAAPVHTLADRLVARVKNLENQLAALRAEMKGKAC